MNIFPGLVEEQCNPGLSGWGLRCDGADYNEINDSLLRNSMLPAP